MKACILYHNPRCSKSKQTLELLQTHNIDVTIIEYLKTPLNREELLALRSHFDLKDFVRTEEPFFKQLGITLEEEEPIIEAMLQEPILMQRPIVIYQGTAIIARPPESVLQWIE